MKKIWIAAPLALLSGTACGQEVAVTPLLDARLRYETTEQDGLPSDADALTLRVRPGTKLAKGRCLDFARHSPSASLGKTDQANLIKFYENMDQA